jgi:hypothetical protein
MVYDIVPQDDGDGFGVDERRSGFIIGSMIKFVKPDFIVDKAEKLPEDRRLVALSVITAWVKWQDGLPTEHRVTQPGQTHPHNDDLPDRDQSTWEIGKFTGKPIDPWHDTRYLRLIDPLSGKDYTFVTDSAGGRVAVGDLKSQIKNVRFARPGVVPIVELRSKLWKTQYGLQPRPVFEVVEWRGGGDDEPMPQTIEGPDNNRGAIEHRKAEFDDSIPF